jgi:chromosome segregation ATPase
MLEERDISIGSLSANIDILTREIDKITEGKEQLHEKIRVLGEQNKALFSEISKLLVKKQGDEDAALQFILNFDNKKVRDRQYEDELNAANKTLEDLNRKQYSTIEGLEDQLKHVKKNNEVFIKSILDYDLIPRLNRIELVEQFRTIFKL